MKIYSTKLGKVANIIMGQSPPGFSYNERGEGLPFYQGVKDFQYRFPTPRVYCTQPSRIAQAGDILISVRAPIGKSNIISQISALGCALAVILSSEIFIYIITEFAFYSFNSRWK